MIDRGTIRALRTLLVTIAAAASLVACGPPTSGPACVSNWHRSVGSPCAGNSDCAPDLVCADDSFGIRSCRSAFPCNSDADCTSRSICGAQTRCVTGGDGAAFCEPAGASSTDGGDVPITQNPAPTTNLDILLMIDNSNSMSANQTTFLNTFGPYFSQFTATSIHLGVVSSDLGTPGSSVPGCANSDVGDDGLLNPIHNGQALARHEPWTSAPAGFGRPTDCTDPNQYPAFIGFESGVTDAASFRHDFQCNAGLYINGCGLESQLDSIYRALVINDASSSATNTSPNAGFLREDGVLLIVVLSDEEDGSVRDCRYANGTPCSGIGAIDVYNPTSTAWSNQSLNMRFYMYQPCGAEDPTWPLERYVDPHNASAGLLSLKPGHPERIVFEAIIGVPLSIPTSGDHVDWNGLLGVPTAGPDDFCQRNSAGLGSLSSDEGPVSMAQANLDPQCTERVVPACRREGSPVNPTACTTTEQYFAWPGRRLAEIARRFDESALCRGAACRNGFVSSICQADYTAAIQPIAQRVNARLAGN